MIRASVFTLVSACTASAPAWVSRPDRGAAVDLDADLIADTDTAEDTGGDSVIDTALDTGGDTSLPVDPFFGFAAIESDTSTWESLAYEIVRYEIGPDAVDPYRTLFDGNPTFFVFRPTSLEEGEQLPVLTWLHGGAVGDDSIEIPDSCTGREGVALSVLASDLLVPHFVAERRWAMLLPINDWCDAWRGQGPADAVDPARHYGAYHASRSLDFVLAGRAGFEPTGELFGWGTSAGGAGMAAVARMRGDFDALVIDSSPCDLVAYYDEHPDAMVDLFGDAPYDAAGQPTSVYNRYREESCDGMVREYGFRTPVHVVYNSQDRLVPAHHLTPLVTALQEVYRAAGVRYGAHDFDHPSPGVTHHVQSRMAKVPMGYSTEVLMQFLEGRALTWVEAEAGCAEGTCTVGEVHAGELSEPWPAMSLAAGRESSAMGVLYAAPVPADLVGGRPVRVTAILNAKMDSARPRDPLVRLTYQEGSTSVSATFLHRDFAPDGATPETGGAGEMVEQYRTTQLVFTPVDASQGTLVLETLDEVVVRADAFVYASEH